MVTEILSNPLQGNNGGAGKSAGSSPGMSQVAVVVQVPWYVGGDGGGTGGAGTDVTGIFGSLTVGDSGFFAGGGGGLVKTVTQLFRSRQRWRR